MMYLVYTAMLALNVSAEVVNGFKSVGNAMNKSNQNMEVKLQDTYDNFENALKNNHDKVVDKYEKAQKVKALSKNLAATIDSLTYEFIGCIASKAEIQPFNEDGTKAKKIVIPLKDADGKVMIDSVRRAVNLNGFSWIQKLDDNHAGTHFFLGTAEGDEATEGAAVDLKKKILEYKNQVRQTLGEDSSHVSLGLNVEGKEFNSEGKLKSWEMLNFNETVAGAALITLVRMKAEVMNAEFDAVNMLYKQVKSNDFSFDKIAIIARPSSPYVMQGGKYELTVNVGAYDSKARFEANVGGSHFVSNDSGAVVYSATCNTTGPKTVTGTVYVKNDNGTESYEFKQSYYVAAPMAVYELTEMNVVYANIDNPIRISVPGTAAHDVIVTVVDPTMATLTADKTKGDSYYTIKPKKNTGKVQLRTSIKDGKATRVMSTQEFRIRMIPTPKLYIGNYEEGKPIKVSELKNASYVRASYGPEFAFKMKAPQITNQKVFITRIPGLEDLNARGKDWTPEIKSAVAKSKPGCKIVITADVVLGDGRKEKIERTWTVSK